MFSNRVVPRANGSRMFVFFPSEISTLPFRVDESVHFEKESKNGESVLSGQTAAMNERPQQLVTYPGRGRAIAPLPSFLRVEISQELAVRAIKIIAEICEATMHELQEICSRKPDFIDYRDLDSLLSIIIIERLIKLTVEVLRFATGFYLVREIFEPFL